MPDAEVSHSPSQSIGQTKTDKSGIGRLFHPAIPAETQDRKPALQVLYDAGKLKRQIRKLLKMYKEKSRKFASKGWSVVLGVAALGMSFCLPIRASQSVTLAWNPDSGTNNVAGYAVYSGTNSSNYSSRLDTGTNTTATVSGLKEGLTYYFAVTAYNTAKVESAPSAPITYLVPGILALTPAAKPGNPVTIKFPVAPGHSYTVQATVDMKTWTNLWQTGTSTSNAWVSFQDSQSSSFRKRFYRLTRSP